MSWLKSKTTDSGTFLIIQSSIHANQKSWTCVQRSNQIQGIVVEWQARDWTWFVTKPSSNHFQTQRTSNCFDGGHKSDVSAIESAATKVPSVEFFVQKPTKRQKRHLRLYKHVFETKRSPNYALIQAAVDKEERQRKAAETIKRYFYKDDFAKSVTTVEFAMHAYRDA